LFELGWLESLLEQVDFFDFISSNYSDVEKP